MEPATRRTAVLAAAAATAAVVLPVMSACAASRAGTGRARTPRSGRELVAMVADARDDDAITLVPDVVYTLPRALRIRRRRVLLDGAGATVRLADGAGVRDDRLLTVDGTDNVVRRVHFAPRATRPDASPAPWSIALTGRRNTVERCRVTTIAATAIGVAAGSDHVIADNLVTGGGAIGYAWADVQRTRCEGNTVLHAKGNAMTGVGNAARRMTAGHRVVGNRVRWCARFGIEDWGAISGTLIQDNDLRNVALTGISAVGGATRIVDNRLRDAGRDYGIETAANGVEAVGNTICWDAGRPGRGTATGIMINDRWVHGDAPRYTGFRSSRNSVTGAGVGWNLFGRLPAVSSTGDRFRDCRVKAMSVEPQSVRSVTIADADIRFDIPSWRSVDLRDGISVTGPTGARITGTTIRFTSDSAGGPAQDFFVRVETDRVLIRDCTFDGGGRRDEGRPVVGNASARRVDAAVVADNVLAGGARLQPRLFAGDSVVERNRTA